MAERNNDKPQVCLLAASTTSPSVLYGLYDVLSTVGAIFPEMTVGEGREPLLDVKIVAAQKEPFRCYGNIMVEPAASLDEVSSPDVAIVCDMYQPRRSAAARRLRRGNRLAERGARRRGLAGFSLFRFTHLGRSRAP